MQEITRLICSLDDFEMNYGLGFKKLLKNQICSVRFKTKQYFDNLVSVGKIRDAKPEEIKTMDNVIPQFAPDKKINSGLHTIKDLNEITLNDKDLLNELSFNEVSLKDNKINTLSKRNAAEVVEDFFKEK